MFRQLLVPALAQVCIPYLKPRHILYRSRTSLRVKTFSAVTSLYKTTRQENLHLLYKSLLQAPLEAYSAAVGSGSRHVQTNTFVKWSIAEFSL